MSLAWNYQDRWQKDRFNFKSKTWNKGTKTRTQRLKSKTWSVQNQNINIFYYNEVSKCKHIQVEQGYKTRSYFILMLNILKVIEVLPLFIPF